ncbi:uncharacterized protein LOC108675672 [Hyalella azteca]|uniref:Uncharacterized protein LOC108675672 n=1 Tax=Hyalella azteca TaxID=294128 RepID=A0A8B7NZD2_HYAAZ|nr:uncharacterized protein LOC108675672 [Hyalella azteca]
MHLTLNHKLVMVYWSSIAFRARSRLSRHGFTASYPLRRCKLSSQKAISSRKLSSCCSSKTLACATPLGSCVGINARTKANYSIGTPNNGRAVTRREPYSCQLMLPLEYCNFRIQSSRFSSLRNFGSTKICSSESGFESSLPKLPIYSCSRPCVASTTSSIMLKNSRHHSCINSILYSPLTYIPLTFQQTRFSIKSNDYFPHDHATKDAPTQHQGANVTKDSIIEGIAPCEPNRKENTGCTPAPIRVPESAEVTRRGDNNETCASEVPVDHNTGTPRPSAGSSELVPTVSPLSQEPRPKGVLGYVISRYSWYVERLQKSLENEMPRTFRMFRIFSVGLKSFIKDFTGYVRVLVTLSFPSGRLEGLSRQQLELYHFMPHDMVKVFPVLLISAVPFGQNLALPLGYFFPRQLLCRHFWDLQQSHDFAMRDLRRRVQHARPVFRCLQASVEGVEPLGQRVRMQSVCHLLGSGRHPRQEQVLQLQQLFSDAPYSLRKMKHHHSRSLLKLHGLSAALNRKRLRDHARWLLCHDRALAHEAGALVPVSAPPALGDCPVPPFLEGSPASTLADDSSAGHTVWGPSREATRNLASLHVSDLKTSLLIRGISPIGLDSSAMAELLSRWLSVSLLLTEADSSLVLHLPVLLFYNHPTNMALVAP